MARSSSTVEPETLQVRYVVVDAHPDARLDWGDDPDHPRPVGYCQGFGVTAQNWSEACDMIEHYVKGDIAGEIVSFEDQGGPDLWADDSYLIPYLKESNVKGIWYKTGYAFYGNDEDIDEDGEDDDPSPISHEEADSIIASRNPEDIAEALNRLGSNTEDIMWATEKALQLLRDSNLEIAEVAASYLGYIIGYSNVDEATRLVLLGKCKEKDIDESLSQLVEDVAVSSPEFRSSTGTGKIS